MSEKKTDLVITDERIINQIYLIREEKVMLDSDLAELFGVETKQLKRQANRNIQRFPKNFMFELTEDEAESLRCQIGTSKIGRGGARYLPYVFTEHGVLMLANVLKSERAIHMSVRIIEVFVKMRELALTHKEILVKLQQIENKVTKHDEELEMLFKAVKNLLTEPKKKRVKIGYKVPSGKKNTGAKK